MSHSYYHATQKFGGSFQGFIQEFVRRYNGRGTGLQLVTMVTDTFPSFRDECQLEGRTGKCLYTARKSVNLHM